jgi:hypothetical protein
MPEHIMSSIPKSPIVIKAVFQNSYSNARGTQRITLSLKGLPGPTTDRNDTDMPPSHHVPAPTRAASPPHPLHESCRCCCAPHDCTHRATIPLMAARVTSPCPLWLHACVAVLLALANCLLVHFPISYFY